MIARAQGIVNNIIVDPAKAPTPTLSFSGKPKEASNQTSERGTLK